ncbi:L,D-transpeptidase family protein [Streptomyces sp. NPDC051172]|uniref:L,D-transpeptidase family protein n=1 Tax=Streptomyces sp. NPDC051172 TaxID=3155796 RepID=UPI003421D753
MINRHFAHIACQGVAVVLAAVAVLPAGAPSASAAPPPPDPRSSSVHRPTDDEDAVADGDLVEVVPHEDAAGKVKCSRRTGPYQRAVEKWLKLKVDGKQSAADCRAVRDFQEQHGIKPAIGFAGPATWATMQLISAKDDPNARHKCPVRKHRVACVDLDRQVTWVQKGGEVVYGPVPMRSGRVGHATRTGWHKIYWKHRNHWSTLYNAPMPYAQFFSGGQAFHGVHDSIYTTLGSWGCINLRLDDARKLWRVLKKGDRVYVWGHRPGK